MKRLMIFVFLMIAGIFTKQTVYAGQIVDTGGGNISEITTESTKVEEIKIEDTTEATTSDSAGEGILLTGNMEDGFSQMNNDDFIPNVSPETFFNKIYKKLFVLDTAAQNIVAFICAFFFILSLCWLCLAAFGKKGAVGPAIAAMLICAICFVCDLYAMQILGAFTNFLAN